MAKIVIDPGHGGTDSGAVGNGLQEANIIFENCKNIQEKLKSYEDTKIKLTRSTDKFISLSDRAKEANAWGADVFVSIHINAGGGTGFETCIYNGLYKGKDITQTFQHVLHAEIMKEVKADFSDRGKRQANFAFLRQTSMYAILTENGFIDTKDADKLKKDAFLDEIAQGHVNCLVTHLGLMKESH